VQASGEAIYTLDQPQSKEGLWACYVASHHPLARFDGVDTSAAMQLPGVVAYISADDIPKGGVNSALGQEPVFAEGLVEWVGQPIGLLVAVNRAAAERGAQLVKVCSVAKPVADLTDVVDVPTPYMTKSGGLECCYATGCVTK